MLLGREANPNAADTAGRTCLHLSAINGRLEITESLLSRGARVDTFDRHRLATPLFCAAVSDNPDGVRLLLGRGADINAGLHEYGVSALHCAVRANCAENAQLLLEAGANPNNVQVWKQVPAKRRQNILQIQFQLFSETPLHTAASMGYDECVRLLVEHGACLEVLMGSMKMTALHLAAQVRGRDQNRPLM